MAPDVETNKFYWAVEVAIEEARGHNTVVMGDWNTKLRLDTGMSESIGKYRIGKTSPNGKRLKNLALGNNLKIINTFFNKPPKRKWTWRAPNNKTLNEIDHFLVSNAQIITDNEILNKFNFSSDHRIGRARLRITFGSNKVFLKAHSNIKTKTPDPVHKESEANEILRKNLKGLNKNTSFNSQEVYDMLEEVLGKVGRQVGVKRETETTADKLSDGMKELIEKRSLIRGRLETSRADLIELCQLRKIFERVIRKDVREYERRVIKEVFENSRSVKKVKKALSSGKNLLHQLEL